MKKHTFVEKASVILFEITGNKDEDGEFKRNELSRFDTNFADEKLLEDISKSFYKFAESINLCVAVEVRKTTTNE